MGNFKEKLKNKLHLHGSASQIAEHHESGGQNADAADPSSSGSPNASRNSNKHNHHHHHHHRQSQSSRPSISNDDNNELQRKRTNTSVTSSQDPPATPSRPTHTSASNSILSFPPESPISQHHHSHPKHPQAHAHAQSLHQQPEGASESVHASLHVQSGRKNDSIAETACHDYATSSVDSSLPSRSASASIQSREGNTLDSSAWTEALPSSIDEKPELTLQEPSPEAANAHPPAAQHSNSQSHSTNFPSSTTMYTPATTQANSSPSPSRMSMRKLWVKRPGAAATLVSVRDDDMVDDAKDMILRKYGNSLGRQFDAPDVVVKLVPRDSTAEVILSPDDELCRVIDKYYHGTQKMHEALIIHVPQKKTPRHSPGGHLMHHHHHNHYASIDDNRPHESGTDYFPLVHPANSTSPNQASVHDPRSIAVLTTGQLPPLASPGGTRRTLASRAARPNFIRHNTASPTALTTVSNNRNSTRPRIDSGASDKHSPSLPTAPSLTPPIADNSKNAAIPPTPRVSSPRPRNRRQRPKHATVQEEPKPSLLATVIDTSVPPINVLIVEDNMINMKLLEQFVRRLKVHWATAVNGREAVNKWRQGGFHLVLMDIQLPIMSGLDATREIRRLERVNHIGVLSGSSHSSAPPTLTDSSSNDAGDADGEVKEEDVLADTGRMFKSPVIIVALTASNLQSDRHEALAAGCNDFLTKPVNFVWFERKVKEWGCMQALIDFDGWRKWKDNAVLNGLKDASNSRTGPAAVAKASIAPTPAVAAASATAGKRVTSKGDKDGEGSTTVPPSSHVNANQSVKDSAIGVVTEGAVDRNLSSIPGFRKEDSGDTVTA